SVTLSLSQSSIFPFSPSLYISFFLCSYGHPRDLHSFPTRRSSDLLGAHNKGPPLTWSKLKGRPAWLPTARLRSRSATQPSWARRSEEQTSELQSPCNLVCRLLLEKKKNKK